jgi:hypothetical protein
MARRGDRICGVPIPAAPAGSSVTSIVTTLFRQVHDQLRHELDGLDDDAINWAPTPGANSIATIVTHLVGSEAETLRCVAGVESERDRDAEFVGKGLIRKQVLDLLERADHLITEVEPRIDPSRLLAVFPLPTLPADEIRPGLTWLVGNYGHAREHVGEVQLTKQLQRLEGSQPP